MILETVLSTQVGVARGLGEVFWSRVETTITHWVSFDVFGTRVTFTLHDARTAHIHNGSSEVSQRRAIGSKRAMQARGYTAHLAIHGINRGMFAHRKRYS